MSDKPEVLTTTEGGISGLAGTAARRTANVAAATNDELNTLRGSVRPFACWKIDDMRFAFDSSVVQPGLREDLANLLDLIRNTSLPDGRPPLLSVFGHADPTGAEGYNKILSGRRARSMYGLLTRKVDIWERLYSDSEGTNDRWGAVALQLMSDSLGEKPPSAGDAGTRRKLFRRYMDLLCHSTNPQGDLVVDPVNFLGKGGDAAGKADVQGCGEHNPLLLLSEREHRELSRDDRNTANSRNRRVTVLLFRPGTEIEVARWPCPTTHDGPEGCHKRFFVDHARRQRPHPDQRRRFEDSKDTFRCRFYEAMSMRAPCESPNLPSGRAFLAVQVFFHARPMQGMAVQFSEVTSNAIAKALGDPVMTDADGLAVFPRSVAIGNYACEVEYQRPQLVSTVFDKTRPEILVLPIGRPHVHVDGDVEFVAGKEN